MTEASLAAEGDETDAQDNTIITDASLFRSSRTEVRSTFTGTRFFLSNANVMRLLAMSIAGWDDIPNAVKENCYFVINNPQNISRHARGRHSTFEDNCWSCLVLYYIIWYGWLYHQSGFGLIPKIIISPDPGRCKSCQSGLAVLWPELRRSSSVARARETSACPCSVLALSEARRYYFAFTLHSVHMHCH